MKKYAIILCLVLLSGVTEGCSFRPRVGPPWMHKMLTQGPPGPTNFQLGWRDGCETGIAASANTFQRQFYRFKQDSTLAQDPTYYTGWRNAFNYCQRYVFQYLRRNII